MFEQIMLNLVKDRHAEVRSEAQKARGLPNFKAIRRPEAKQQWRFSNRHG